MATTFSPIGWRFAFEVSAPARHQLRRLSSGVAAPVCRRHLVADDVRQRELDLRRRIGRAVVRPIGEAASRRSVNRHAGAPCPSTVRDCHVGDRLAAAVEENVLTFARQRLQDRQRRVAQRHAVRLPVFMRSPLIDHVAAVQVDLGPWCADGLPCAGRRQDRELERLADDAIALAKLGHECRQLAIGHRRMVLRLRLGRQGIAQHVERRGVGAGESLWASAQAKTRSSLPRRREPVSGVRFHNRQQDLEHDRRVDRSSGRAPTSAGLSIVARHCLRCRSLASPERRRSP